MAGKKERQRRLARERYARQSARRARKARVTRRWTISATAVLAVAAIGVGGAALGGVFSGSGKPVAASSPSASDSASATPSPTPAAVAEPAHHCVYTPSGTAARKVGYPPATPDWKAKYRATIHTNRGNIVVDLLNSKATCTVNSFAYLAAKKYFSDTRCYRLTTTTGLYLLQCGDPTETGHGGPGYVFADENLVGATYKAGTVAMISNGPNTNGSQFFMVYKDSTLPPNYTPFGTIVSGVNIIQKVASAGSTPTGAGQPKEKVVITSVTIKKT